MPNAAEAAVPAEFELFRKKAYQITGLDLTSYKAPQMHRRLTALLSRLRVDNFAAYARLLEIDAQRRQEFCDYVTINVSEFFRDSDRFGELERKVVPTLLSSGSGLRVWSARSSSKRPEFASQVFLEVESRSGDPRVSFGSRKPAGFLPRATRPGPRARETRDAPTS